MSSLERGAIGAITLIIIALAFLWVGIDRSRFTRLLIGTTVLTLVLIVLGAYVRLADAGLGCPDWPGCYGNLTPAHSATEIRAAEQAQPGGPVSMAKAWKEMIHRYLAMLVGALIAAILLVALRCRRTWQAGVTLPVVLAGAVILQAALGAWTVTLLLKPAIVTAHLLGGMLILAMLTWLLCSQPAVRGGRWGADIETGRCLRVLAVAAWGVLFVQIALGGWVSTNYAALACTDFPTCHGAWVPAMDFANAFHIVRPLGVGPDGELLTIEALRAIQWTHRVGALVTAFVVGAFAWRLAMAAGGSPAAAVLAALLVTQILLGMLNVWMSLPLPLAVAHNGVAALLLAWLTAINLRLVRGAEPAGTP
jgi:cytochrome c oxidase assembly protein subunit 15